jgi:hypothetical protein
MCQIVLRIGVGGKKFVEPAAQLLLRRVMGWLIV